MIKFALALVAALFAVPAMAADLPSRIAASAPSYLATAPAFSWTGFHVDGLVGGQWGDQKVTGVTCPCGTTYPVSGYGANLDGINLGVGLGYDLELMNRIVIGVAADLTWSNAKGDFPAVYGYTPSVEQAWFGTVRGRVGYSFGRVLPYLTAGLYFDRIEGSVDAFSASKTRTGWTVGAGVEYALTDSISLKGEYLYVRPGSDTLDFATPYGNVAVHTKGDGHIVRAGASYRF